MISGKIIYILFAALIIISAGAAILGTLSSDTAAFFLFVLVLATLIFKDRKKVKFEGIYFIRRTQKGRDFIDRTAKGHKTFFSGYSRVGLVVGIIFMAFIVFYLLFLSGLIIFGQAQQGVKLVLPGPGNEPINAPGVLLTPWWIWIIGIAAVIIPHEFMHGVVCRLNNIKIRSVGWVLLVLIPGAFVEPDERQLKKAKKSVRLKMYAAGSFANLTIAYIISIILIAYFALFFAPAGLYVGLNATGPANLSGMPHDIISIDGMPVMSQGDLATILAMHKPGDTVTIKTVANASVVSKMEIFIFLPLPNNAVVSDMKGAKDYKIQLGEYPGNSTRAYLGVTPGTQLYSYSGDISSYLEPVFFLGWIYIFSFGIGMMNLVPLKPFDGGLLFEDLVGKTSRTRRLIIKATGALIIFLILFNLIGPILLGFL